MFVCPMYGCSSQTFVEQGVCGEKVRSCKNKKNQHLSVQCSECNKISVVNSKTWKKQFGVARFNCQNIEGNCSMAKNYRVLEKFKTAMAKRIEEEGKEPTETVEIVEAVESIEPSPVEGGAEE